MVEKHGKTWRYDFLRDGLRYKKGGFRNKQAAVQAEAEARAGVKSINTDFLRLCTARLEDIEIRRSKHHFLENKKLFEILMQFWGNLPTITRDDVEEYLREAAKQSKPLANKRLRLIKALFNHGIKRNWFTFNPANGIDYFGVERKTKYIPPIEDIEKVMEAASEEQRKYLTLIGMTLARVREINNLKWEDVHFEENYLVLRTRKAKNSDLVERKVPMTTTVRETLLALEKKGEYVFVNPRTKTKYDYRDKFLPALCARAEVKPFMYHALRHYGASKLSNAGVPLTDIQAILGHQRATTTDIYLQSLRDSLKESIKKLEE
jgi:integrase